MGKILLFNVNLIKAAQIASVAEKLGHVLARVSKEDYHKSITEILIAAAAKGAGNQAASGKRVSDVSRLKELPDEMMVIVGLLPDELDEFLQAYANARIAPVVRKAVMTPVNQAWNVWQLFDDLDEHAKEMG